MCSLPILLQFQSAEAETLRQVKKVEEELLEAENEKKADEIKATELAKELDEVTRTYDSISQLRRVNDRESRFQSVLSRHDERVSR